MQAYVNLKSGRTLNITFTRYTSNEQYISFYNNDELKLILWHSDASYVDIKV